MANRCPNCLPSMALLPLSWSFLVDSRGDASWPSTITWWIVSGAGLVLMALLGEYLCIRRELREIPITRYRSNV
ncbi:hypothetical protein K2173_004259 [Erythroxylum novogranatense]|uniref:Uncharacterized protein n=1 Tax=Erythroxylum novogranatense TaxID=1862640 RepID=A0AAV8U5R4_9ROSI|nr:hypothetical protein K2173_004259 [Erythroxylum novogranatense]